MIEETLPVEGGESAPVVVPTAVVPADHADFLDKLKEVFAEMSHAPAEIVSWIKGELEKLV